jgi:hypothetical protein
MLDSSFSVLGYKVVRGLINPSKLFNHIQSLEKHKQGRIDSQVSGSRVFYKDSKFEELLVELKPVLENHVGLSLHETYSFARIYKIGDILKSHRDRNACEISVTISLGNKGKPWPIWFNDKNERAQSVILEPGDGLIYKGIELAHWRELNECGDCSQVFLHYVDQNGPYALHRKDRKNGIWFNVSVFNVAIKLGIIPRNKTKGNLNS